MAKKIIQSEEQGAPEGVNTENQATENTPSANEGTIEENKEDKETNQSEKDEQPPVETASETQSASASDSKQQTAVTENYPPFVESILKSFPIYESLYIDAHGGVYTPTTAPVVRGNAILYKNPFHNL